MQNRYSKFAVLALALVALAPAALADVLWDQSTVDPAGPGIVASNSPGFNGFVAHSVNDVVVPAEGWHITRITQYYGGFNYNWEFLSSGYVNVTPKGGSLPSGTPSNVAVPMSCANTGDVMGTALFSVVANVSIDLVPGSYWIGLTPSGPAGLDGANLLWASAMVGSPVATYMAPGPWDAFYGNYDGAFKIEGYVNAPVPTGNTSWGRVKSLFR